MAPGEPSFDVPPTAGLPLTAGDLRWAGRGAAADLGAALSDFLQVEALQLTCSGTAALVIALTALRRLAPQRREVVVPAYTCPLVALAVARCGLQLRLCDLQADDSLDLDAEHLQRLCSERTLALLPTHLGGRVGDAAAARACAGRVGAWVVEDAAQALGATVDGRSVGQASDLAFFSLAVGKGLSIFEGGALWVREPALRAECRRVGAELAPPRLGWTGGISWEMRRSVELLGYAALYRPAGLRLAYGRPLRRALRRGDWVEAAGDDLGPEIPLHRPGRWRQSVGVRALARLRPFLNQAAARAQRRCARLAGIGGVRVLLDSAAVADARGVWPVLLVLLPTPRQRDAVLQRLWGAGCGVSLPFVHALPDYRRYAAVVPRAGPLELPHARALAARLLAVSNSPWLDDARFERICDVLEREIGLDG